MQYYHYISVDYDGTGKSSVSKDVQGTPALISQNHPKYSNGGWLRLKPRGRYRHSTVGLQGNQEMTQKKNSYIVDIGSGVMFRMTGQKSPIDWRLETLFFKGLEFHQQLILITESQDSVNFQNWNRHEKFPVFYKA